MEFLTLAAIRRSVREALKQIKITEENKSFRLRIPTELVKLPKFRSGADQTYIEVVAHPKFFDLLSRYT